MNRLFTFGTQLMVGYTGWKPGQEIKSESAKLFIYSWETSAFERQLKLEITEIWQEIIVSL